MRATLLGVFLASIFICLPLFASAAGIQQAPFHYNRITANYDIQKNGDVKVDEPVTMLFNQNYHSLWVSVPPKATYITGVVVADGATGEPMTYSPKRLDDSDPASWGKYTFYNEASSTKIEWYFNTSDHVHTWVVHYTLPGAVTFYSDHDEFSWDISSGLGAPLDTVEATVHLPGAITQPQSYLYTTNGEDYYIDRPDDSTFRFRVSGIAVGELVSIKVGWQKGLIKPSVPLPSRLWFFNLIITHVYAVVGVLFAALLALLYIVWKWGWFKTLGRLCRVGWKQVTLWWKRLVSLTQKIKRTL